MILILSVGKQEGVRHTHFILGFREKERVRMKEVVMRRTKPT